MENYKTALGLLTSAQKFKIKLGLERINALLGILGNPHKNLKCIHVAGTNGKGSVCAILASVLKEAGYKTGLYTSPHLVSYTERIKINNKPIEEEKFAKIVFEILNLAEKNAIDPTEFEILTAAMFKYFSDENAEVCVIETGLGGRFDATNVIETPLCSVITSISKDHTERLGDTIEKITFEKAGIIKMGSTVVCLKENAGFEVIKNAAEQKNAKIFIPAEKALIKYENGTNFAKINGKTYEFSLLGRFQEENLTLAIEALNQIGLKIPEEALKSGLKNVFHPCRIQFFKEKNLIIDGAHNPDGARKLRESLDFYFPDSPRLWIFGALRNKDFAKIAQTLFKQEDEVYFYEFSHKNHANFDEIAAVSPVCIKKIPPGGLKSLIDRPKTLKIIAGSIYMEGEIIAADENLKKLVFGENI